MSALRAHLGSYETRLLHLPAPEVSERQVERPARTPQGQERVMEGTLLLLIVLVAIFYAVRSFGP